MILENDYLHYNSTEISNNNMSLLLRKVNLTILLLQSKNLIKIITKSKLMILAFGKKETATIKGNLLSTPPFSLFLI